MEDDVSRSVGVGTVDQVVPFVRSHRIARVENRLEREEHVLGGHRRAVAPAHAGPQTVANRPAVARDATIRHAGDLFEQDRLRPATCVEVDERLEHQACDLLFDRRCVGGDEERVEVARVGGEVEPNRIGRLLRGCSAPRGEQRRQGEPDCP